MKEFRIDKALLKKQRRIFYLTIALIIPTEILLLIPLLLLHLQSIGWMTWTLIVIAVWLFTILPIGFLIWRVTKTQLTVSAEGIRYSSPGISLYSTWDNIEAIRKAPPDKSKRQDESIVLRKPGKELRTWWYDFFSRNEVQEISLAIFPDWRTNELGKEIKRYAPRLLKT